jgi:DNA-binding LacI/PurR family transcriptional regulator
MIQRDGEIADFNHVCFFIKTLIDGSDRPNAIMCNIDTDAAMVMKAIFSLGLRVPEDMAVTGFYNLLISRLVHPELTTVETRAADIGYTAMKMLDERIANPSLPHTKIYTNAEIIVRKSTSTF